MKTPSFVISLVCDDAYVYPFQSVLTIRHPTGGSRRVLRSHSAAEKTEAQRGEETFQEPQGVSGRAERGPGQPDHHGPALRLTQFLLAADPSQVLT